MIWILPAIIAGVVAAFIVGGLIWAFVADRRRNEDVATDPERLDTDPERVDTDPGAP